MKKAAKILSVAVLAMAALAGAIVATGWIVHAQEGGGEPQTVEAKEAQAAQLAAEGQHAPAAALYDEASSLYGDTPNGQRTAVEAGRQYSLSNQQVMAIAMFDRAISNRIRAEWREAALSGRAAACENAGLGQEPVKGPVKGAGKRGRESLLTSMCLLGYDSGHAETTEGSDGRPGVPRAESSGGAESPFREGRGLQIV